MGAARSEVDCHVVPQPMSPTVFREGPFRFFFFSREESRPHVHVGTARGEAKVWLRPRIELARQHGLRESDVRRILGLTAEREREIRDAWSRHFES